VKKLNLLDLFSGAGGFSLGLENSGAFSTVAFCEIFPYPRKILKQHWPKIPIYEDVKKLSKRNLESDGIVIDAICGGFPCQDISEAGAKAGLAGERSGLWFEYARIIGEVRPKYIIIENVSDLLVRGFDEVLSTLASLGYDAVWHCIQACDIGAPHIRDRVWIVGFLPDTDERFIECWRKQFQKSRHQKRYLHHWEHQSMPARVAHGVPHRMDRIGLMGNAIVPQIAEIIGLAIKEFENNFSNPLDT
jgi:DNA (cytosine-5)-methyltransferase 1